MLLLGICLMVVGLFMSLDSIFKATRYNISPTCAAWMCYGGIFVAILGAVCIGKIW